MFCAASLKLLVQKLPLRCRVFCCAFTSSSFQSFWLWCDTDAMEEFMQDCAQFLGELDDTISRELHDVQDRLESITPRQLRDAVCSRLGMQKLALEKSFDFPYLYDPTQEVALAYKAACTPDFYLFDQDLKLAYRGRFDNARPKNDNPVTGKDLMNACQKLSKGAAQESDQIPSLGCNIKWKAGNEPNSFLSI